MQPLNLDQFITSSGQSNYDDTITKSHDVAFDGFTSPSMDNVTVSFENL